MPAVQVSPLNDFHVSRGAKMVDFAGWSLPVSYRGVAEEHNHTRSKISVFDVSHMGRLRVEGDESAAFLQGMCTRDLAATQVGQSRYTHICNEQGGIIDDAIIGRHEDHWILVCNGANRASVVEWLNGHKPASGVDIVDETMETAMLAIQGPTAVEFVERTFSIGLTGLKRYWFVDGGFMGMRYSIARSGYTGEDGVEATVSVGAVELLLPMLFGDSCEATGDCKPAGLAARDTLRLEAGMPLYGHELSLEVDPLTAGQGWCVQLDVDFVGADALRAIKAAGVKRRLVGFELDGKRVARQGYAVLHEGRRVGEITSGTMSPTLHKSIAMGYVEAALAEPGTCVSIDLGRKANAATVVRLPFYKK